MKLVKTSHRIAAVLIGITIVILLTLQIIHDGKRIAEATRTKQEQNKNEN